MKKILVLLVILLFSLGMKSQFTADFSSNKTFGCAPLIIKFTDASSADANQWTWTSTSGISSNEKDPTIVFDTPGNFDVTLEVTNGTEVQTKTISVRVSPGIYVDFSTTDNSGCIPFTTQFNDLSVPQSSAISSWFWSFTNGTTSTDQNPTVTFETAEKFDALLKITDDNGCEATFVKPDFITAGGPVADFIFDSITCSLPANVSFINISQGENLSYEWAFGNGNGSSAEIPMSQTYSVYDTVPVTLYIQEDITSCTDSVEKLMYIRNYQAKMEISAACTDKDFSLTIKDVTSPTPSSIIWDLGDGSQSINSEFTHIYSDKGSKIITLTATIGNSCTNTQTFNYTPPIVSFGWTTENSCSSPYTVNFINYSAGTDLRYEWAYGDTSIIDTSLENSHNYVVPPIILSPNLSLIDTFGCTATLTQSIIVPIPLADFNTENEKISGCAPLTIDFVDLSKKLSNPIKELIWNYGDPSSGSLNVGSDSISSHTFNTPGKYDITLIIILDNGCSDTLVKKEFIKVGELATTADFNINFSDTICYGETLSFDDLTTYSNPTYFADFHCWSFEEGPDPLLTNSETPPFDCPEVPSNFLPTDNFVHSQIPSHHYSNYNYENGSSKDGYNYIGEMVPKDSTLNTHLFVGFHGCYQEVIKPVYVIPTAAMVGFAFSDLDFNLTECDSSKTIGIYNASVNYDSLLYFRVIYEPTADTLKNIAEFDTLMYTFNQPGNYVIQIGVYNKVTLCKNEISRSFLVLEKNMKITAPAAACWNSEITAIDESTYSKGQLSQRIWLLNGAIKNASFFPIIINDTLRDELVDTGWTIMSLEVSVRVPDEIFGTKTIDVECLYNYSDSLYIEGTEISIKLDTNVACAGDSVLFTNASLGTSNFQSVEWILKDSSQVVNSTDSFKVAYNDPNTYVHSLIINSTYGCLDTLDAEPLIVSFPIVNYSAHDTVICKGDFVNFTNSSVGHDLSATWTVETSTYTNINASHTFLSSGLYDVKLHEVDFYGCEDSAIVQNYIRVSDLPVAEFHTLDININCPPFTIQLLDSSSTPAVEWEWNVSDGGKGSVQYYLHTFVTAGKFDVEFISTNIDGCSDTIMKPDYIVVKGPAANATVNKTQICSPDSVKFNMSMSDVAFFVWNFNDGTIESKALTSDIDSISHVYSKSGVVNPIFSIIDSNNCVVVVPDIPSIAIDSLRPSISASEITSCNLDSIEFTNNSTSYFQSTFSWDYGDDNVSSDSVGVHKFGTEGTYDVKLMMASSIGCLDTTILQHTLYLGPSESLTVTNDYFCVPTNTILQLNYGNGSFIAEDVNFTLDGANISGDSIGISFTEAKSYDIGYQITYGLGYCSEDSSFTHQYYELPEAEFDFSPKNLSLQIPLVFFTSSSINSTLWDWQFGDGNTQNIENPGHSYIEANNYPVQLIVSNPGGCKDTAIAKIAIAPGDIIRLPNAFTPNGDGFNDEFGIIFAGNMEILSFKIFNRWGNLVFRTSDIKEKWDGIFKDKPQNHGTYVYYIKGRNENGEILEYKGNFSLIR